MDGWTTYRSVLLECFQLFLPLLEIYLGFPEARFKNKRRLLIGYHLVNRTILTLMLKEHEILGVLIENLRKCF